MINPVKNKTKQEFYSKHECFKLPVYCKKIDIDKFCILAKTRTQLHPDDKQKKNHLTN